MNHTPTPWRGEKLRAPNGGTYYRIYSAGQQDDDGPVVQVFGNLANDYSAAAQVDHIVRCVNAHDRLTAALRDVRKIAALGLHPDPDRAEADFAAIEETCRAALAEAGA